MSPEEFFLLLGYLRERISLLDVSKQCQFSGGCLSLNSCMWTPVIRSFTSHLVLTLLLVQSGQEVGKLCDLLVVGEDNWVSTCLKLHRQVGRL